MQCPQLGISRKMRKYYFWPECVAWGGRLNMQERIIIRSREEAIWNMRLIFFEDAKNILSGRKAPKRKRHCILRLKNSKRLRRLFLRRIKKEKRKQFNSSFF